MFDSLEDFKINLFSHIHLQWFGGEGPPVLFGSRIGDATTGWETDEDQDVASWDKTEDFLVAVGVYCSSGKKVSSRELRLEWEDTTNNPGTWTPLGATGDLRWDGVTRLVDGNTVGTTGIDHSGYTYNSAQSEESEGSNSSTITLASLESTELQFAINPSNAGDSAQYTFRIWNVTDGASIGTCLAQVTMATGAIEYTGSGEVNVSGVATTLELNDYVYSGSGEVVLFGIAITFEANDYAFVGGQAGLAFPDYDYDLYEDFENALGGSWSEIDPDTNIDPQSAFAKYYGSQGMLLNSNGATPGGDVAYIQYNHGSELDNFSIGFWFRGPDYGSSTVNAIIANWTTVSDNPNCRLYYRASGSQHFFSLRGTGFSANVKNVNANTFYWITIDFHRNGTCTLRVYNIDKSEVDSGTPVTVTANDVQCNYFTLGHRSIGPDRNDDHYFDDLVMDWTDATFPLAGWATGAGGQITISGTATTEIVIEFVYSGSGQIIVSGTATISRTTIYEFTASGTASVGGLAATECSTIFLYTASGLVQVSGAASTQATSDFTYTGLGAVVVSGFATTIETSNYIYTGSGTVIASGVAATSFPYEWEIEDLTFEKILAYFASGSIAVSGFALTEYSPDFEYVGSGEVVVEGSSSTEATADFVYTASGQVTLGGTAVTVEANDYSYSGSGEAIVSGAAVTETIIEFIYSGSGGVQLSGAATTELTVSIYEYIGSGQVVVSGAASTEVAGESVYTGSGTVLIGGSAVTSFTAIYSYSGSGQISVSGETVAEYTVEYSYTGGTIINPIGLWRLDEGEGVDAADSSGNNNNGTLEGTAPTWIDGKSGKAVNLPGVNERINCGNNSPLDQIGNGSFWIPFWMKSKDLSPLAYGGLFSKREGGDGISLISGPGGTSYLGLQIIVGAVNLVFYHVNINPFDTLWNHIVWVVNRTTNKSLIYWNKVKDIQEDDLSTLPVDCSNSEYIEWGRFNRSNPSEVALDELRIYTGIPTQADIDYLFKYPGASIDFGAVITTFGVTTTEATTNYVYSGSGHIAVSGAASTEEIRKYVYVGSGEVIVSGAAITQKLLGEYVYSGSGEVAVGGVATSSVTTVPAEIVTFYTPVTIVANFETPVVIQADFKTPVTLIANFKTEVS